MLTRGRGRFMGILEELEEKEQALKQAYAIVQLQAESISSLREKVLHLESLLFNRTDLLINKE